MEELDFKSIFKSMWEKRLQIILIIVIFVAIGIAYTMKIKVPEYSSSTTLALSSASGNETVNTSNSITTTDITLNTKLLTTYSELIKSNSVIRQVIENLKIDISEDELRNDVSVTAVTNTSLIQIVVTTENAEDSAKIAKEITNVFIDKIKQIYNMDNVHIVDEAKVPDGPSNINHKKDVLLFTVAGFVVAIIYVFALNAFDTTIKSSEEVEKNFKIPVLAEIPLYSFENKIQNTKNKKKEKSNKSDTSENKKKTDNSAEKKQEKSKKAENDTEEEQEKNKKAENNVEKEKTEEGGKEDEI